MKINLILISICFFTLACAQQPDDYYDSTEGLEGYELKTALKNIISNHTVHSYGSLNSFFNQMDPDIYFENDNSLLDIYSENPESVDPYNFGFSEEDQCGEYGEEGDCWNKEHIFPQSFFNEQLPMRSDIHQILPTDGYVNGMRSNFPFGEVESGSQSQNGSKLGTNSTEGFDHTVFEPIDEFKGDIARILFYFATRYEDEVTSTSWDDPDESTNNPLNGTNDQVYEDWYVQLLLSWHIQDPVSQKEIDRNNAIYIIQSNRNPFVDHPEFVQLIWGDAMVTTEFKNKKAHIFPNPFNNLLNIEGESKITLVEIVNSSGNLVYRSNPASKTTVLKLNSLPDGVYYINYQIGQTILKEKILKSSK